MPHIAFFANFLWVMVLGLLGPSVPAMVLDLEISYSQAGLFFTVLSLGSLIGTFFGGIASDHFNRKTLFILCSVMLFAGLICMGFAPNYIVIIIIIFLFSLLGSPVGAVGQSVMLKMFPEKRDRFLSYQTMFAALGSFLAPVIISLNFTFKLNWRWAFIETGFFAVILLIAVMFIKIPPDTVSTERIPLRRIMRNGSIRVCFILVFLSMAMDVGFAYWLAEYFKTELSVSLRLSSAVVGIYLAGIIAVRLAIPQLLKRFKGYRIIKVSLVSSIGALLLFIFIPSNGLKAVMCLVYGLAVGPLFPLTMARGAGVFPEQPGAVTGVMFAALSLGGMVFPFLLGFLAENFGIAGSYLFSVFAGLVMLIIISLRVRGRRSEGIS